MASDYTITNINSGMKYVEGHIVKSDAVLFDYCMYL